MSDYVDMFRRVAQSVRCDYAAYASKEQLDQGARCIDDLTFLLMHSIVSDVRFARIASNFLDAFGDPCLKLHADHGASAYKDYDCGIETRRFGDALYVERSSNPLVHAGDRITKLDYWSIPETANRREGYLYGTSEERELWDGQLHFCDVISLEREGAAIEELRLPKERTPIAAPENSVRVLDGGVVLVTLWSLVADSDIEELTEAHASDLQNASRIVIDVRRCAGSSDSALACLAPIVADEGMRIADFVEETCLVNYSERNCALLESSLADVADDPWARSILDEMRSRRGEGLVPLDCGMPASFRDLVSPASRAQVAMLIDTRCTGTAETLAEMARASSRCTLVGRNTMGSAGSSFPVNVPLGGNFWLEYPIACYSEEARKRHFCGTGVSPDVPVAWTPDHIACDVDLEAALGCFAR